MRWDDLTMGQKSALMRIYINNGVTSLDDMRSHYNSFAEGGKTKPPYKEWVKKVNPDFVGPDYNLEAAYNDLPYETLEAWRLNPNANHLPDTYKRPNHPTFSEESVYSQGPIKGGTWYYEPVRQGQYMPRELLVGGINGVEPNPMYRSFDDGGSPYIPPERFFGIATPDVTDNTLYKPSYGTVLPTVEVTAKGDPRKVNNDYYKAHAAERAAFEDKVARRVAQGWVPRTMLGLAALPFAVEGAAAIAPTVGRILTHPLVDAALTTHGAITAPQNIKEGIQEIKNGDTLHGIADVGLSGLDIFGGLNILGRAGRFAFPKYRRDWAYRTIYPFEYDKTGEELLDMAKGAWYKDYEPTSIKQVHKDEPIRSAAFRKYLGLEDDITRNLFTERPNGTYNIEPEFARKLWREKGASTDLLNDSAFRGIQSGNYTTDNVYNVMGKVGGSEVYQLGDYGILRLTDNWDLQPFKKTAYSPKYRISKAVEDLGTNIRKHTYDQKILKPIDFVAEKMQNATDLIDFDTDIPKGFIRNLEVDPILGGKPFYIEARIPLKFENGKASYNPFDVSLEDNIIKYGSKTINRKVKSPFEQF